MDPFIPGSLEWARGVAVDISSFFPWVERVVADACALFRRGATEVHLDNSGVRIYSSDSDQMGTRHRRAGLLHESISACGPMEDSGDDGSMAGQIKDYLLDETKKGIVRFLATSPGGRVPGISKKARECWCVVERTPPYAPKVQPIESV